MGVKLNTDKCSMIYKKGGKMAGNSLNLCKDQAKDIWIDPEHAFANEFAVRELKRLE